MEQPLLGKISTLTEKKKNYVVKNYMHKIRGLHRVKIKSWYKMSAGSGVGQGSETGAATETVQNDKNSTQKWRNKRTNVFKIECCGSFGLLPAENENL
jgi:hypothetical protein